MLAATRQSSLRAYGRLLHAAGAGVVALIAIGFYVALHRPIMAARADLDAQVSSSRKRLEAASNTRTQYESLNDRLHESEELAAVVRSRIPQQPQTPQFLGTITEKAENYGMAVRDFTVGEVFERETHHEVSIRFSTSGDYESICGFLDQLMSMQRVVAIEQLTLNGETEDGSHEAQLALLLPFGIKSAPETTEGADEQ